MRETNKQKKKTQAEVVKSREKKKEKRWVSEKVKTSFFLTPMPCSFFPFLSLTNRPQTRSKRNKNVERTVKKKVY